MVILAADRLSVKLRRRPVLRDITASLRPGALIGIVGPNGAGKSTLVRALAGLVPPASGMVSIDGRALAEVSRRQMARSVAYLPQGQMLHWPLSVERLVALGRLPHLAPFSRVSEADTACIEAALRRADVLHLRHRIATELSGGERARVMLARTLAVGAAALIADEPLAALDPGHQLDVMQLLTGEAQGGKLVIAVLHDLAMAARFCNRLLLLKDGRLVADGAPSDILSAGLMREVYGISVCIDHAHGWPLIIPETRVAK